MNNLDLQAGRSLLVSRAVNAGRGPSELARLFRREAVARRRRLRVQLELLEDRLAPAVGAWSALGAVPAQVSNLSTTNMASLPQEAQYAVSESLGRDDPSYAMAASGDGYTLGNATNQYVGSIDAGGLRVASGSDTWSLTVRGIGYGDSLQMLGDAQTTSTGNRVEFDYGGITQWFVNGPFGLQQGFTLAQRPSGSAGGGPLTVDLALGGDLTATADAGGRSVTLARADGSSALSYGGLIAYDATGKSIPADITVITTADGDSLSIRVDDADAVYPLVIDPLVQQARFKESIVNPTAIAFSASADGRFIAVSVQPQYHSVTFDPEPARVYVYMRTESTWVQTARLTVPGIGLYEWFGYSVAISAEGTTLAVGFPRFSGGPSPSSVYVYARSGTDWSHVQTLVASDEPAGDTLGSSVAISGNGDVIVSGAPARLLVDGAGSGGAAYVFTRTDGSWVETIKLAPITYPSLEEFGGSVAVSADGRALAVNSGWVDSPEPPPGSVFYYTNSGNGWSLADRVFAPAESNHIAFGTRFAMSADGSTLLVGAAHLGPHDEKIGDYYVYNLSGSHWVLAYNLADLGEVDRGVGRSFAINSDGTLAVIGLPGEAVVDRISQGVVHLFARSGTRWTRVAVFAADDGQEWDHFGYELAVTDDEVFVGAYRQQQWSSIPEPSVYAFGYQAGVDVVKHPASVSSAVGVPVTFTAGVGGPNFSAQWQVSRDAGETWTDVVGANQEWYTITPSQSDFAHYRAVFTRESTGEILTTLPALLSVYKTTTRLLGYSSANPKRIGDPLTITVDVVAFDPAAGVPNGGVLNLRLGMIPSEPILTARVVNGRAVFQMPELWPGAYAFEAYYDGTDDPVFTTSYWSWFMTQVVTPGPSTLTAVVPSETAVDDQTTLRAVLDFAGTGAIPTGRILFMDGGRPMRFEPLSESNGVVSATLVSSSLAVGDHYIQLIYLGDSRTSAASSGVYRITVKPAGSTIKPGYASPIEGTAPASLVDVAPPLPERPAPADVWTPSSVVVGKPVTLTAVIGVDWKDVSTQWQVSTDGGGSWTDVAGEVRSWYRFKPVLADSGKQFRAVSIHDDHEIETSEPVTLNVVKARTFLWIRPDSISHVDEGFTIYFGMESDVVAPKAHGGVAIRLDVGSVAKESERGALNDDGEFGTAFRFPTQNPGYYPIRATYDDADDPFYGPAVATNMQMVVRAGSNLDMRVDSNQTGDQIVRITVTVRRQGTNNTRATGGVLFLHDGQPIDFVPLSPDGYFNVTRYAGSFDPGKHLLEAIYLGDTWTMGSTTTTGYTLYIHVRQTSVSIERLPLGDADQPIYHGEPLSFQVEGRAGANAVAGGQVTFRLDGDESVIGSGFLDQEGRLVITAPLLPVGTHTLTALLSASDKYEASGRTIQLNVLRAPTTTTLTSSRSQSTAGDVLTFTATVAGARGTNDPASGTVIFYVGSQQVATVPVGADGKARLTTSALVPGAYTLAAVYLGTSTFESSKSNRLYQTVSRRQEPTTTTLTSSRGPSMFGDSLTFTATVTGATGAGNPSLGLVRFYVGLQLVYEAPVDGSGRATLTTSALVPGTYMLTAVYLASDGFQASMSNRLYQTVIPKNESTITTLTSSQSPSTAGDALTFTATIVGASGLVYPTSGTVQFYVGTQLVATAPVEFNGRARLTTSALVPGTYMLTAVYLASDVFQASMSNRLYQTVQAAPVMASRASAPAAPAASRIQAMRAKAFAARAELFVRRNPQQLVTAHKWS